MSLIGIALIVLGVYIAIKVAGLVVRLAMVLLVVSGLYLVFGPFLGH